MDWIQKHYDRVVLAVLGLLVIAFAGIIISKSLSFGDTFATRDSTKPPDMRVPSPETELVKERIASIEKPADWGVHEGSLFVSEPYVSRGGGDPNPIDREGKFFDPIPNEWIKKYNLPISANFLNDDPDSDKFSNLEEFTGGTDPSDPKSMPPYITKLRLLEFIQVPFRLKFSGQPDPGTFAINTRDLHGPTQFLKIGDMIAGTTYKIVKFEPKTETKNDMEMDVSELTIENQESGQKIILVNDKEVNDPTVYALFKYLWDGSQFKVRKLDSFSVKPEDNVKYKLIDISDNEAVIENTQTKATIHVPRADSK